MNDESKVRRSTKSVVLGKAKVMSYEDLQEAREKRAKQEAAKEAKGKGKLGRKPKSAAPEAEEATADKGKRGRKRKSAEANAQEPKAKVARMSEASEPAMAPVAQMIAPVAQMIAPVAQMIEAPEPAKSPSSADERSAGC